MHKAPEVYQGGGPRELSRGGSVEKRDGWIILRLRGSAYERGFQHGYFLASEIREAIRVAAFLARWDTGEDFSFFVKAATKLFEKRLDDEILGELHGIVAGAAHAGTELTFEELLAWNGYQDLLGAWWPALGKKKATDRAGKGHRCSAFIATGSATADGSVVAAHNTWLVGDVNTAEIARIDLGLKYLGVERTQDGAFQGFNVAEDLRVRNQECGNSEEYSDIRKNGARRTRLSELLAAGAMDRGRGTDTGHGVRSALGSRLRHALRPAFLPQRTSSIPLAGGNDAPKGTPPLDNHRHQIKRGSYGQIDAGRAAGGRCPPLPR